MIKGTTSTKIVRYILNSRVFHLAAGGSSEDGRTCESGMLIVKLVICTLEAFRTDDSDRLTTFGRDLLDAVSIA